MSPCRLCWGQGLTELQLVIHSSGRPEPCSVPTTGRGTRISPVPGASRVSSQVSHCFPTEGAASNLISKVYSLAHTAQEREVQDGQPVGTGLATVSCPLKSMGIFSTTKKVNLKRGAACLILQVTD